MEELKIDFKIVDIDLLVPNTWNPKKDNPEEYQKVVDSIRNHGLKDSITVREKGKQYEIIDGFHRWKACKELGYTKIIINNLGIVDDIEARELTIVKQKISVPFDEVMYAQLLVDMLKESNREEILTKLPISVEELDAYIKMAEFNFDDLGKDIDLDPDARINDTSEVTCPECGAVFKP